MWHIKWGEVMRYKITVSYDGSKYYGFQRLLEKPSVQKYLEEALSTINKKEVTIKGAGRTDRGVHARGQCCHFDLDVAIPADKIPAAMNRLLPESIRVLDCEPVSDDFHARFFVKKKEYVYKIYLGKNNPFLEDYTLEYPYPLDIHRMKKAAKLLLGVHDFSNFVSGEREDSTSILYKISFVKTNQILEIHFVGKSFYRYMVRNLVGALIKIGSGKEDLSYIEALLDPKSGVVPTTISPNGLYLMKIMY